MTTNPRKRRRIRRRIRRLTATVCAAAVTLAAVLVLPAGAASEHYEASAAESLADVQAYWAKALPATYGRAFAPIPADRVHPYSSASPPPACGGRGTTPYREVAGNAFYCEEGDFVAYDEERLVPTLRERYGDVAVGLVLAHEIGHAVQARVGAPRGAFVYIELQADCFAGAWAQRVTRGDGTNLRMSDDDLDRALAGFLDLRDPSGVDGGQQGAHGNAFDRVSAFQDGLDGGAAACRAYTSDPPEVTEEGFASYADQAINGDLPLDDVLPMVEESLDTYWDDVVRAYDGAPSIVVARTSVPTCTRGSDRGVLDDGVIYCAGNDTIVYTRAALQKASSEIGDMGAGVLIAAAWASAVQHDLGESLETARARSVSECLAGAWAGSVQRGTTGGTQSASTTMAFSPGDLDEVIAAFVAADVAPSKVDRGSVFERVTQFRTGFDDGPWACLTT